MQHVLFETAQLRDCCNIMHAGVQFMQSNYDIYADLCKYKAQLASSHCMCIIICWSAAELIAMKCDVKYTEQE